MAKEMYCPYCGKIVKASKVRWLWVFVHLLIGYLPIYLIYCALVRSRVCTECHHRIYKEDEKK